MIMASGGNSPPLRQLEVLLQHACSKTILPKKVLKIALKTKKVLQYVRFAFKLTQ